MNQEKEKKQKELECETRRLLTSITEKLREIKERYTIGYQITDEINKRIESIEETDKEILMDL